MLVCASVNVSCCEWRPSTQLFFFARRAAVASVGHRKIENKKFGIKRKLFNFANIRMDFCSLFWSSAVNFIFSSSKLSNKVNEWRRPITTFSKTIIKMKIKHTRASCPHRSYNLRLFDIFIWIWTQNYIFRCARSQVIVHSYSPPHTNGRRWPRASKIQYISVQLHQFYHCNVRPEQKLSSLSLLSGRKCLCILQYMPISKQFNTLKPSKALY